MNEGVMLDQFVTSNREEIIQRCRAKVAMRVDPPPTGAEIKHGIPLFLDQLVGTLRQGLTSSPEIRASAVLHGKELLGKGFTISQVVHDYGDVCQSITDLAVERRATVSADDFRTLNRCLDDAIASAVTEFGTHAKHGEVPASARGGPGSSHELQTLCRTALVAFEVIEKGQVGLSGSTGAVLKRALHRMGVLIDNPIIEAPPPK